MNPTLRSLSDVIPLLPAEPFPILIIGTGGIVRDAHLPAYRIAGFPVWGIYNRTRSRAAYCPFAYGYSNYSRPRYAPFLLKAGGLVTYRGKRLRSTLGGAGLAISSKTKYSQACMDFARFTADPETQKGLYFQSGGQPGHRGAWTDDAVNDACNNFFRDTLQTLDESLRQGWPDLRFMRPSAPTHRRCRADRRLPGHLFRSRPLRYARHRIR